MHPRSGRPFLGWRMVALCFLAHNCTLGLAYGSFGPLLASTEQHFGVTRTVASTGMSLITLMLGLLSPIAGTLLQRVSLRAAIVFGAVLSAIGYWGLAVLNSFNVALVMFAMLGCGMSIAGILGPVTLINRWFVTHRAKMLSIVNLPIFLFLSPFIIGNLLPRYGRFAILGSLGTICLVVAVLLLLLVDRPERVGQSPRADDVPAKANLSGIPLGPPPLSTQQIFKSLPFWLLSLGIGVIAGAGVAFVVHVVPFGVDRQLSLRTASGLLSFYAGSGILGTLLFGWIADRLGGASALAISAFCQSLLWWGLLHVEGISLFALAGLLGICVVPLVMLHGAALSELFGPANISRAMGFSYSIKLPFIFGFAPAIGYLFDKTGNYEASFLVTAGMLAAACCLFVLTLLIVRKQGKPEGNTGHALTVALPAAVAGRE